MSKNPMTNVIRMNHNFTRRLCIGLVLLLAGGLIAKLPFTDDVVTAAAAFLSSVAHDASLTGEGTATSPLRIAINGVGTSQLSDGAVTAPKIVAGQIVTGLNGLKDNVILGAGSNVSIDQSGNTLTISSLLGLTSVAHDSSLNGDGLSSSPLSIAASSITAEHLAPNTAVRSVNNLQDSVTLIAGSNISITASGNSLTIASNPPAQPYINPLRVATLQWYEANQSGVSFSLPQSSARHIAFDGTHMWVTNGTINVYKIRVSDGAVFGPFVAGGNGGGIAFDGANMWVVQSDDAVAIKLRGSDGAFLGEFSALPYTQEIVFDGTHMWTASIVSNSLTKFRASDGATLGTVNFGSSVAPRHMAFDGTYLWVTLTNGTVAKVHPSNGEIVGTFNTGTDPRGIAFDGVNMWVTNYGGNTVTKLRVSDGVNIGTFNVGINPWNIAFDGANMWVTHSGSNSVTKLRGYDGAVLGTFSVGTLPFGIAFDGANMWVAHLSGVTKL